LVIVICLTDEDEAEDGAKKKGRKKRVRGKGKKKKEECHEADEIEKLFFEQQPDFEIPEQPLRKKSKITESEAKETKQNVLPVQAKCKIIEPEVVVIDDKETDGIDTSQKSRHAIRQLVGKLEEGTKLAGKMEAERRERVKKLRDKVCIWSFRFDNFGYAL